MDRVSAPSRSSSVANAILQAVLISCIFAIHGVVPTVSYAEQQNVNSTDMDAEEVQSTTAPVDLTTDDAAYLTQLGLLRGHLMVGFELYQRSLSEMSATHMKHPNEELYADLIPAFEVRGCEGFADELSNLALVVSDHEAIDVVASSYELLSASIGRCEAVAERGDRTVVMKVVMSLLTNALLEYEIGVVNGSINNVHEYQDAWGFTQVASEYARLPVFLTDDEGRLVSRRLQQLITSLDPLWPSLNPTSIDEPKVSSLLHRLRAYTSSTTE